MSALTESALLKVYVIAQCPMFVSLVHYVSIFLYLFFYIYKNSRLDPCAHETLSFKFNESGYDSLISPLMMVKHMFMWCLRL